MPERISRSDLLRGTPWREGGPHAAPALQEAQTDQEQTRRFIDLDQDERTLAGTTIMDAFQTEDPENDDFIQLLGAANFPPSDSFDNIIQHVADRNWRANKPDWQTGHCAADAKNHLKRVLDTDHYDEFAQGNETVRLLQQVTRVKGQGPIAGSYTYVLHIIKEGLESVVILNDTVYSKGIGTVFSTTPGGIDKMLSKFEVIQDPTAQNKAFQTMRQRLDVDGYKRSCDDDNDNQGGTNPGRVTVELPQADSGTINQALKYAGGGLAVGGLIAGGLYAGERWLRGRKNELAEQNG